MEFKSGFLQNRQINQTLPKIFFNNLYSSWCTKLYKQNQAQIWEEIFKNVIKSNNQFLAILLIDRTSRNQIQSSNQQVKILFKLMPGIQFTTLKSIYLVDNLINNLEIFQNFKCPVLEEIQLKKNLITDIKCLRKAHFFKLQKCDFRQNKIKEINLCQFGQCNLWIKLNLPRKSKCLQCQNINFRIKISVKPVSYEINEYHSQHQLSQIAIQQSKTIQQLMNKEIRKK